MIKISPGRAGYVVFRKTPNDLVGIVSVTYTSTATRSADERWMFIAGSVLQYIAEIIPE
jgi:hypothetical protein